MTRQQRRQLEREQGKGVLTTEEMNSVKKRAYAVFLKVLEKALPNAGISKVKTDKIIQEMHYSMAEMEVEPLNKYAEGCPYKYAEWVNEYAG